METQRIDVPPDHQDYGAEISICPICQSALAYKGYKSEAILLALMPIAFFGIIPLNIWVLDQNWYQSLTSVLVITFLIRLIWAEIILAKTPRWEIYE